MVYAGARSVHTHIPFSTCSEWIPDKQLKQECKTNSVVSDLTMFVTGKQMFLLASHLLYIQVSNPYFHSSFELKVYANFVRLHDI